MSVVVPMSSDNDLTPDPSGDRSRWLEIRLDTLFQVSLALGSALQPEQTLQRVLAILHRGSDIQRGLIALLDPVAGQLRVGAVHGRLRRPADEVRYLPGEGIVGGLLVNDEARVIPSLGEDPAFLDRLGLFDRGLPLLAIPIRDAHTLIGALAVQPPMLNGRACDELRFLQRVSELMGQNLALAANREVDPGAAREPPCPQVRGEFGFDDIIGRAPAMRRVFEQMRMVAKWTTTVLIRGESGTGKELVASGIHYHSPRANGPFIKLNCAALPDNLLESELFGHEKGAFTGAVSQRKGRFEQAHGGTLFLDEMGEISPAFQAKLLRVLQEGEFERVGGHGTQRVDVRIIAATNRNLEIALELGEFREDLYYRLNVMPIQMPPLRERLDDIPELAQFLVARLARRQGRGLSLTDSAVRLLIRHDWPGNVRELENRLERAAVMSESGVIDRDSLGITGLEERVMNSPPLPGAASDVDLADPDLDERERVIAALEQSGWVQAKAARLLNMTPRQIAYRIQTLNIRMRRF